MKPGTKLAILLIGGLAVWSGIIWLFATFLCCQPKNSPKAIAQKALYACVDNPESVKILAVSKPDSVFGRDYIDNDEKMAIATSMMNVNVRVMERTNGMADLDFEDRETTELMERQMSAMSVLRPLMTFSDPSAPKKPFNGWKVKIEYEAVSESGCPYRSEYWFILDKDCSCVVNSFEIPIIENKKQQDDERTDRTDKVAG